MTRPPFDPFAVEPERALLWVSAAPASTFHREYLNRWRLAIAAAADHERHMADLAAIVRPELLPEYELLPARTGLPLGRVVDLAAAGMLPAEIAEGHAPAYFEWEAPHAAALAAEAWTAATPSLHDALYGDPARVREARVQARGRIAARRLAAWFAAPALVAVLYLNEWLSRDRGERALRRSYRQQEVERLRAEGLL